MKPNLNLEKIKAIKKLKNDETISIYSFDKCAGLVRIKNEDAMEKIQEQIGNTTIIDHDPTPKILRKVQTILRSLKHCFTQREYRKLYQVTQYHRECTELLKLTNYRKKLPNADYC